MKQTYIINGMTCNGCKSKVEYLLNELDAVTAATVNLETAEATIEAPSLVPLELIDSILPEKYTVQEASVNLFQPSKTEEKSELKQLFPLFLIFLYITAASILMNVRFWDTEDFMLDFMGLFYIVFSFFKFLDYKGFPNSFQMYDPLAKQIPLYAWIYPFLEVMLGLMFLFRFEIPIALIATIVILGITTIGVTKALLDKKTIQCACLGTALKLPMTKATFIENSIMLVMAIWMLINIYA
ncbi:heavy-metal-associated domain-containing protein [uncultured Kordia sp.]|uniref:heavy-metal-associated domain-containing protein n=1 Tax=uncultured Kordia sp. TaxID=507699 RepID=UPI002617C0A3|nr:MauE/DoxX family redox-associated membrane protein [uncultured Kordia sp.]